MADIAGNFIRGRQFAQAEAEHQQALEDSKLRQQVLKHQIDQLKIEDQLRARSIQAQQLQMMQGTPESEMPQEPVQQQNLPSRSFAGSQTGLPGLVSGMVRDNMGGGDQAGPTSTVSPNAQSPELGTNSVMRPRAVQFSAV